MVEMVVYYLRQNYRQKTKSLRISQYVGGSKMLEFIIVLVVYLGFSFWVRGL